MNCLPANRQARHSSHSKNFLDVLNLSHVHGRTRNKIHQPSRRYEIGPYAIADCHDFGTSMQDQGFESKESNRLADMSSSKAGARLLARTLSVFIYMKLAPLNLRRAYARKPDRSLQRKHPFKLDLAQTASHHGWPWADVRLPADLSWRIFV